MNKDVENVYITTEKIQKKFDIINQVELSQMEDDTFEEKITNR